MIRPTARGQRLLFESEAEVSHVRQRRKSPARRITRPESVRAAARIRSKRCKYHRDQLRKPAIFIERQPSGPIKDISGKRFGKLVAISFAGFLGKMAAWHCQCDCGRQCIVRSATLNAGKTKTCGCSRGEVHGLHHTREYRIWQQMLERCLNPKNKRFDRYGGRGIRVCKRWLNSFKAFYEDMGPSPTKLHTLDRRDNDGHYSPGNCRWATQAEQASNTSQNTWYTAGGRTQTLSQWAREIGTSAPNVLWRLKHYPQEIALLSPKGKLDRKHFIKR